MGFASWQRYCIDVSQRGPTKLCTMFRRLLGWYIIYIFWGSCLLTEICPVQNSLYVQVLRSLTLAALLHGTPACSNAANVIPRLHYTTGCHDNRFDYRVERTATVRSTGCQTGLYNRVDNRIDSRLYFLHPISGPIITSLLLSLSSPFPFLFSLRPVAAS